MKIYIAAPLFNEMERERNRQVCDRVHALGFETYLPQEDGGIAVDLIKEGGDVKETRAKIFSNDVKQVKEADAILCLLDGSSPDEGVCIELGMAHALGKICIGYLTDQRSFNEFGPNPMVEGCLTALARSPEELDTVLQGLQKNSPVV